MTLPYNVSNYLSKVSQQSASHRRQTHFTFLWPTSAGASRSCCCRTTPAVCPIYRLYNFGIVTDFSFVRVSRNTLARSFLLPIGYDMKYKTIRYIISFSSGLVLGLSSRRIPSCGYFLWLASALYHNQRSNRRINRTHFRCFHW